MCGGTVLRMYTAHFGERRGFLPPLTLGFFNAKAGTGKSTLSAFLATALAAMGLRVLVVDADPGGSLSRWSDLADGKLPFTVVRIDRKTLAAELPRLLAAGRWDAMIIDAPQSQGYAPIARAALDCVDNWIIPVAPSGIELDRLVEFAELMDSADPGRTRARRMALLNDCARARPTKAGKDAQARRALSNHKGLQLDVFPQQIHHCDDLYKHQFGTVPEVDRTPFPDIARALVVRAGGTITGGQAA